MLISMYQEELVVNIDGCSFGRYVKTNYSWLPKGKTHPIINEICRGSANILLGLLIEGTWLWMILDWPNTSNTFLNILVHSEEVYRYTWNQGSLPVKVMLDNASVHLTQKVKRLSSHLSLELNYFPLYWPILSQLSYFLSY